MAEGALQGPILDVESTGILIDAAHMPHTSPCDRADHNEVRDSQIG